MHPILFLSQDSHRSRERLDQIREGLQFGHAKRLWEGLKAQADEELTADPITPESLLPDRQADQVEMKNLDWSITNALEKRIMRHALAFHLTNDERYRDNALAQLNLMFDTDVYPAWCDIAAYKDGKPTVHLRTGSMAKIAGIAYDWLKDSLSASERQAVIEGLDRRAIQPYLKDVRENNPWWTRTDNNWCTCIVGGLAIAGMALKGDHPQSEELIDFAIPRFKNHIDSIGTEGEFNEGVGYGGAMILSTDYFAACASYSRGEHQFLSEHPFPQNALWYLYMTVPPGHLVAFGDGKARAPLKGNWVATIAHAAQDGILQWYYHRHHTPTADPSELLYYDASLAEIDPEGVLPRGRAYHEHGACISSRSSWDSNTPVSVVMSKARREDNHEHNDIGQVCIDGYGRQLIVDLGTYGAYPRGFFTRDRTRYYDAQAWGHNVPVFGEREMKFNYIFDAAHTEGKLHNKRAGDAQGIITRSEFSDAPGSIWAIDTTAAYDGVIQSVRTVLHLFPGIVVVLDEVKLEKAESVSIRWHTADSASPTTDGAFTVVNHPASLSARILSLDDVELQFERKRHAYTAPWDQNQFGARMEERHSSFVEAKSGDSNHCRILSLFSVNVHKGEASSWGKTGDGLTIETESGKVVVSIHSDRITVGKDPSNPELTAHFSI